MPYAVSLSSWISPRTVKGKSSSIHGLGFFAVAPLRRKELVGIKGGHIIDKATVYAHAAIIRNSESQISEDLFIAPLTEDEFLESMMFMNHSCNPNCVIIGDTLTIAWRDIAAGEELTFDYTTLQDSGLQSFVCSCGSLACRGRVAADDWKIPELQQKYGDYFTPYLLGKIRATKN